MKSSKFKRIAALLLALSMMATAFAGCSGNGGSSSSSASSAVSESSAASSDAGSESSEPASSGTATEELGFEAEVVPLPDEAQMEYPVENGGTLSIWCNLRPVSAQYYQSLAEDITVQCLEEETGIDVEFVHPATGQEAENFNLMVVSGTLPDIIVDGDTYYSGGAAAAVEDGVFADLTDLVPEYAPDYNYFLENNDMFWRLATAADGSINSIYCYKDVQAPFYLRTQFRQDWLDEWDMDVPETFDEYEAYFQKVQEEYPDVSPFTLDDTGLQLQFLAAFGIATNDNGQRFFVKDGKVSHTFNEDALLDYLTLMNDWYAKGYINRDFLTLDDTEAVQAFVTGQTASVVGNSDNVYTLSEELGIDATTGPFARVNEGDPYHGDVFYFPQNGQPTSINAKSENIELALQWLNYGFTKQGAGTHNFGDPETTWTWSEEVNPEYGTTIPEYTDYALNNTEFPLSDIEYTLRLHVSWAKYRYGDDVSMIRNVSDPDCWNYRAKWSDDETVDSAYVLPTLAFTPEEADEVGTLTTNIDTYAEEMILKFITGDTPLSEFENFQAQVESLGMPRLLELYQNAYDQLLSKSR